MTPLTYDDAITSAANEARDLLLAKNAQYGRSAFHPLRVFSDLGALEGLKLRLDDKLARIVRARESGIDDTEDAELDALGYLILIRAVRRWQASRAEPEGVPYQCASCGAEVTLTQPACGRCGSPFAKGQYRQTTAIESQMQVVADVDKEQVKTLGDLLS